MERSLESAKDYGIFESSFLDTAESSNYSFGT